MEASSKFEASWGNQHNRRLVLECKSEGDSVGSVSVGLQALDSEAAAILIDFIEVNSNAEFRGGVVANWLVDQLVEQWPDLPLRGGPLSADEDPGPSFRLRTWKRGIEFHDGGCETIRQGIQNPPSECHCLARLIPEVERRAAAYKEQLKQLGTETRASKH